MGEDKDDMKFALARLLFGAMEASRMREDSPDDTAASSHEPAGDRLKTMDGDEKKDAGSADSAMKFDDMEEHAETPATESSGPTKEKKSKKKKNGNKRFGGRK